MKDNIQLEKSVKRICSQLERRKKLAYNNLSFWLSGGTGKVPSWMFKNKEFVRGLANITNGRQYIKLLEQFGRHFIVNQAQCKILLGANNERPEKIKNVVSIITSFWTQSTSIKYFQTENWGEIQMDKELILEKEHPLMIKMKKIDEDVIIID